MREQRLKEILELIGVMEKQLDEKSVKRLQLDKTGRLAKKLSYYAEECDVCLHQFKELETHVIHLYSIGSNLKDEDIIKHKTNLNQSLSHLQKKHKVVSDGYYTSIYMSIGISMGMVFGFTVFDNIALGLPIGMSIGIAIGAGMDADSKKKGLTI